MWLVGVVRRYIDILIIIITFPTPLVLALFGAAASLLYSFKNVFSILFMFCLCNMLKEHSRSFKNRDHAKL